MESVDYCIVGAGISGLTFARLLQQHTDKTFIILEKESEIGGLCRTKNIDGNHFDIGGGHFLYSKHQEVYDFIFSHIPESKFNKFDRVTKIKLGENYIDYPIEQNLWQLPLEEQYKYICSIIDAINIKEEPTNFKEWIYKNLGKEIGDNYLIPYSEKIWGVSVEEMSTEWLYKIPKVDFKELLYSFIFQHADKEALPSHPYFYYPKEGGFQVIIDAIAEPLKEFINLNTPLVSIRKADLNNTHFDFIINDTYVAHNIINTIPWTAFPLKLTRAKELNHNSLAVSLEKDIYCNNIHWTYIPDEKIEAHREFYVNNYALKNKDSCSAYETNLNRFSEKQKKDAVAFHINEYAYPIPTKNKDSAIKEILEYFEKMNIFGLGRWGQWQYHNSDVCIMEAMKLFNRLENDGRKF